MNTQGDHMDYDPNSVSSVYDSANRSYRDQDRFLPIANVGKVMRRTLGPVPKISMESKECIQECVSEFISFITSEAADKCLREGRKTLSGDDLLFALDRLGFDEYVQPMRTYLLRYRTFSSDARDEEINSDVSISPPVRSTNDEVIESIEDVLKNERI